MIDLHNGDCLEIMKSIPSQSVDMVLTDPPYGTTACKWDSIIPFEPMWLELKRIIKPNGAIVLFGSEPFSSALRMSNIKQYKYDWVWEKTVASNFAMSKKQPHKKHEIISVFYEKQCTYYPQMQTGKPYIDRRETNRTGVSVGNNGSLKRKAITNIGTRYPSTVQKYSNDTNGRLHPTQKPVELLEYLIKTYTQEGETVLDFTMGSGSAMIACLNTNRKGIGIELDKHYFDVATKRINEHKATLNSGFLVGA